MKAYIGKILQIDLSSERIEEKALPEDDYFNFLGGTGLATKIIFDMVDPSIDPLSPNNILVFMTGPLTGTIMPTGSRMTVTAKSPLTKGWGESHVGGFWGTELKKAGYDGLVITGKAKKPVYLYIHDREVEFRSAENIWGKDTYAVDIEIKKELKDEQVRNAVIGPAGENMINLANICFDVRPNGPRIAGRTGMGAVMGSKNLKAIAVKGTGKVEVANIQKLRYYIRRILPSVMSFPITQLYAVYGTPSEVMPMYSYGDLPIKNFSLGEWSGIKNLSAESVAKKIVKGHRSCFNCPIGCWRYVDVEVDSEKVTGRAVEYETIGSLGSLLMIDDPAQIARLHQLCNKLGIDAISAGVTIAWLIEAYERKLIDKSKTDGLELRWGDPDLVATLLEKMAKREGIGELIGKGVREASKEVKGSESFAMHVKGLEVPMHDPRAFKGMGLQYATSNRGADHLYGYVLRIEQGERIPDLGIHERFHRFDTKGKGRIVAIMEDWYDVIESLGICKFLAISPWHLASIYSLATGRRFTAKELLKRGTAIFNLKRLFNLASGITPKEDTLPERLLKEPLRSGGAAGQVVELESMLKEYYEYRGWTEDGYPKKVTLEDLGLLKLMEVSPFQAYKQVLTKVS